MNTQGRKIGKLEDVLRNVPLFINLRIIETQMVTGACRWPRCASSAKPLENRPRYRHAPHRATHCAPMVDSALANRYSELKCRIVGRFEFSTRLKI
jgi:hypothetical protein